MAKRSGARVRQEEFMLLGLVLALGSSWSPLSVAAAFAADSADDAIDGARVASAGGTRGGGTSSGGSSDSSSGGGSTGTSNSAGGEGKTGKKSKFMGWTYQPYVSPGGGVQIDGSTTSIVAGADVGVKYWRDTWSGNVYAGGSYLTGSGVTGYDVHVGDTTGARLKYWGLAAGAELFYDAQFDANGSALLDPSLGLGVPVTLTVGPSSLYGTASVEPAWLFSDGRKGADVPLGDEFTWSVGAGINYKGIRGAVGFAQRITTAGTFNTPTVSLSI